MTHPSTNTVATDEDATFYVAEEHGHAEGGTMLGFWIYLMSDCLIFAVLFATYGVLGRNYAAGPSPADLFELPTVAINTAMLLLSSITFGFAAATIGATSSPFTFAVTNTLSKSAWIVCSVVYPFGFGPVVHPL